MPRLPQAMASRPPALRMFAMRVTVVLLPLVPVTAMIGEGQK